MVLAEFSVGQFLEQAGLAGAGGRPEVADDARHVDVVTAQSVVARRRIRQLRLLATLACTHTASTDTFQTTSSNIFTIHTTDANAI